MRALLLGPSYVRVIHTHTHALTGAPMGHSDTVQIKNETDGGAGGERKKRRYERRRVFGWYIIVVC